MISLVCLFLLAIAALSRDSQPGPSARQLRQWRKERYSINPMLRRLK